CGTWKKLDAADRHPGPACTHRSRCDCPSTWWLRSTLLSPPGTTNRSEARSFGNCLLRRLPRDVRRGAADDSARRGDLAEMLHVAGCRQDHELEARPANGPVHGSAEARSEPAGGHEEGGETAPRGRPEPARPESEGKPVPVREHGDTGEPANVGRGGGNAAAEPLGDRERGRAGELSAAEVQGLKGR